MGTLDDIVAATKILSEDPETTMGVSGSKPKENGVGPSDMPKDGGSAVVVTEADEESTVDGEGAVDGGLVGQEEGKNGFENLSTVSSDTTNVSVDGIGDGVGGGDGKNKDFKGSAADDGEGRLTDNEDFEGGGDSEKFKNQDSRFHVGDFVWGKIKSHPWWPGQVYDPKDASEFAMKHKQEGRLLVAFFGDGSCSWCLPSQLRPFVENFVEMSRNSSSKSFLKAVERAVDEIGRLLESEMTCKCTPPEKKDTLARPLVANAGLRKGVIMPEVYVDRLSIPSYEPKEVVEKVRQIAKADSVSSALEVTVLKSWLSAFYYFKGGYQLSVYHEPFDIEGMEDKNKTVDEVANDFSVPIEVPILGPQDDDSLAPSDDKDFHRRKQKSVAELMGENKNIKPESQKKATVRERKDKIEKSAVSSQKKKKNNDGELEEASSTGKTGKKRKVDSSESSKTRKEKIVKAENGEDGAKRGTSLKKPKKIEVADTENGEDGAKRGTSLKKPKKIEVADAENGEDGAKRGPSLKKPKKIEVADAEDTSGETKEELETVSTPRERKKSKYLSPPYTNLTWRIGNSSFKTAQVEEHTTGSVEKASEEKLPNGRLEKPDMPVEKEPRTVKNGKKMTFPVSDVDLPVNELLSEIRLAAVDPFYLSNKGSLDTVWAFVSALRSSTYLHGPNYKIFRKCVTDGKRKSPPSELGNDIITPKKAKSTDQSTPRALKTEGKSDVTKSKKPAETSTAKNNAEKKEGKTLPSLILSFAPGFPLPSKKDAVKLFGKFGSLNTKETKVFTDSHTVLIVYTKDSDAEAAFKSSLSESLFGSENVNYTLQRSSTSSKSNTRSHQKAPKRAADKRDSVDDLVSDGRVIKQKFEIMTAILENYHSKFLTEDKSSLKDEMKLLMEKVDTVSEKVRILAENTSS